MSKHQFAISVQIFMMTDSSKMTLSSQKLFHFMLNIITCSRFLQFVCSAFQNASSVQLVSIVIVCRAVIATNQLSNLVISSGLWQEENLLDSHTAVGGEKKLKGFLGDGGVLHLTKGLWEQMNQLRLHI